MSIRTLTIILTPIAATIWAFNILFLDKIFNWNFRREYNNCVKRSEFK